MGEIIIKVNGIFRKAILSSLLVGLFVTGKARITYSGEMPNNPRVQSGSIEITGTGTNHLQINTKTNKTIINWDSFSIHSGGRVDFNQPSANSFSLESLKALKMLLILVMDLLHK